MENIYYPNSDFDFSKIKLSNNPSTISGGAYFARIYCENNPLYLQMPKCLTKNGIIKNGKKYNTELMFSNNDEFIIEWCEKFFELCINLIYKKSSEWFDDSISLEEIEESFLSLLKIYKSGKFYLLKTLINCQTSTGLPIIKIYDESENPLSIEDIKVDTHIISIIEIKGIKFTSKNFQIIVELKQTMILDNKPLFDVCLIKTQSTNNNKIIENNNIQTTNSKIIENDNIQTTNILNQSLDSINEVNIKQHDTEQDNYNNILKPINELITEQHCNTYDNNVNTTTELIVPEINDNCIDSSIDNNDDNITDNINTIEQNAIPTINNTDICLEEIDLKMPNINNSNTILLNEPKKIYYEIYKQAKLKAKEYKKQSIQSYLEANKIKNQYMFTDNSDDNTDIDSDNDYDNNEIETNI
jgi:hypothetical protein